MDCFGVVEMVEKGSKFLICLQSFFFFFGLTECSRTQVIEIWSKNPIKNSQKRRTKCEILVDLSLLFLVDLYLSKITTHKLHCIFFLNHKWILQHLKKKKRILHPKMV